MAAVKRTETEVAAVVMTAMQAEGWDCYPEVIVPGGRADIVGVREFPFMKRRCVWIVECKTTWALSLLEQGVDRMGFAHHVSIAAPSEPSFFYETLCRERGIGMIRFHPKMADLTISEHGCLEPRLCRHGRHEMFGPGRTLESLHPDQKNAAPGSSSAGWYSTPFNRTMKRCAEYVREHPGCTVKEIVANVETHYSTIGSAKQCLLKWLEKQDGVEARIENRSMRFYADGAESIEPELI